MDNGALAEAALDEDEIDANLSGSFPAGFVMPKVGISSSHYPVASTRSQTSWEKVRFGSKAAGAPTSSRSALCRLADVLC
jgi:hypothetical protein